MHVRNTRALLLAAAAFALLLAALFTAAGVGVRTARAADPPPLSVGCRSLDGVDDIIAGKGFNIPFNAGEVLTVTISGSATTVTWSVNSLLVAQTSVPGTMSYTIPASGIINHLIITTPLTNVNMRFSCGVPTPQGADTPQPWYYTQPAADAGVLAEVQALPFNGRQACGAFTADWWGVKYIQPSSFPACADYLPDHVEVACLNEHAEWTTDYVKSAQVSSGVFSATLYQHGTCAIFPTP